MPRNKKTVAPAKNPLDRLIEELRFAEQRAPNEAAAPTAELVARGGLVVTEAARDGNWQAKQGKAVRRVCRAIEWYRWGWLTDEQCKGLVQLYDLSAACAYPSPRSCMVIEPRGHGDCTPPQAAINARDKLDRLGKQVVAAKIHAEVWTVLDWMESDERPNFMEDFQTDRTQANRHAEHWMRKVGDAMFKMLN